MGTITTIIDALRRLGTPTQRSAIARQDEQLKGRTTLERHQHTSRSEQGQSSLFVATIEAAPETVEILGTDDLRPILENAALVEGFIGSFIERRAGADILEELDLAFGAWMEADDQLGYTDEGVLEIAGAAFGKVCTERLNMRWIRVVDSWGTALAVQGVMKDFRGFPYAAVSKRIASGEYGFFKPIYISLQDAAERDWAAPSAT
jgi:hypothetical protein